jgi:predicted AAA+ superfamily ATPase
MTGLAREHLFFLHSLGRWTVVSMKDGWKAILPFWQRQLCKICDYIVYFTHVDSTAVELRLRRSAKTRPVVVLTGARQTGKTPTFLRLFPKHAFVSLDLPNEAEQAEKEPGTFLQRHPPPVLIDEVQYAPGLFRHLKVDVDAHRTRNGQFLLTGSQKFTLMKNVSESLAGRPC